MRSARRLAAAGLSRAMKAICFLMSPSASRDQVTYRFTPCPRAGFRCFDDEIDFRHGFAVGHDTASCCVGQAAFDAVDDLKLAIDIGRYRLGREEGLAAPGV